MSRRPVRNPDLLHTFASVGAQKTLAGETAAAPAAAPAAGRKELDKHDLEIVKRSVKLAMGGGYGQVYAWFGAGAKEHWADSIALGIVTGREGVHDADWVHQLRLAVYRELQLDAVDVASPFRMSDLTKSKT